MLAKQDVFMAIADQSRREILQLLMKNKELALHELMVHFDISRTAVSKHLAILKAAELVDSRKVGRETRYRLNAMPLREVKQWLGLYEDLWTERLTTLADVLKKKEEEK
ncbi:ArsR/SmtB family transcription factor [Fundicoccus sp. Sow4_D5]|uniref:ArsR/SmtB family transcription factor n=1 Tax=Fundicoccus sp. Sow4_D5 TaxID=3438782 RepID=UPI003F93028C